MFKKLFNFTNVFILLSSINIITSQNVSVTAKSVSSYCIENNYYFQLNVNYDPQPTEYIPFSIEIAYPNTIIFRCMIVPDSNKIFCYANFENNGIIIEEGEDIELPYPFPEIKNITWNYDSFLSLVYRKIIKLENTCGSLDLGYRLSKLIGMNWGLVFNIKSVWNSKCNIVNTENYMKFSFNMNLRMIGGSIKNEMDNNKNNEYNLEFLNEIIVPYEIGEYDSRKETLIFKVDKLYHVAFCDIENKKIDLSNYDNLISFICNIPIINQKVFKGPLRIKSFYDHLYVRINSNEVKFVKIFFNTEQDATLENKGVKTKESEEIILVNKKIRLLQDIPETSSKEKNNNQNEGEEKLYLILDNNLKKYYCPDRPIFKVLSPNDGGIQYQSDSSDPKKFNLYLMGALAYETNNEENSKNDQKNFENVKFSLTITDNFIKDSSYKLKKLNCQSAGSVTIPNLQLAKFSKIRCEGVKSDNKTTNADFLLNVKSSQNQLFDDIIIEWPSELEQENKRIYSYTIQALSIKDSDFGCFEDRFYFYIDIYDLNYEPKIYFKIPLYSPKFFKATCSLYNSYTLKCFINLRLQKLYKKTKIELLNKTTSIIATKEGNQIIFDTNRIHYINSHLYTQESCGNNILIGALKDIGFSYLQVLLIIIGFSIFFAIVGILICYCILYLIIHKNKKGKYYAHREEVNKTIGITNPTTGKNKT